MSNANKESGSGTKLATSDQRSPYYLSNSDGPGVLLTNVVLRGEVNYDAWAKAMKNALKAKNKLGFVDGTMKQPEEEHADEMFAWSQCNSMINSWIHNTIDSQLQPVIQYFDTAKELWEDLKERYSVANIPRIYQLRNNLSTIRQQGINVGTYYTRMRAMWDEIEASKNQPPCERGAKCAVVKYLSEELEKERVYQFLMGLDDAVFGTIRTQILNYPTLPNVNQVYALITQEETRHDIARNQDTRADVVGYAAKTESQREPHMIPEKIPDRIPCPHCGKNNHHPSRCWTVNGYPSGHGRDRGRGRGRGGTSGRYTQGQVHAVQIANESQQQSVDSLAGSIDQKAKPDENSRL